MQLLLRWLVATGALYATVWLLSLVGLARIEEGPWYGWFMASAVMGLVNSLIRPVARALTAPLNCLTFGLMGVVVNALMFFLVPVGAKALGTPVFSLEPLGALLGSILVAIIGAAASSLIKNKNEEE